MFWRGRGNTYREYGPRGTFNYDATG
jgi:hypothetical protein